MKIFILYYSLNNRTFIFNYLYDYSYSFFGVWKGINRNKFAVRQHD